MSITISTDNPSIKALRYQLKRAFEKIKEEFSHHLEEINETTNELQANYEYLTALDEKLDKVSGRIENIELFLKKLDDSFKAVEENGTYTIQPLSVNEKRVFAVIFASKKPLLYSEIAQAISLSESLVRSYVTSIIEKGVPIIKKYSNGKPGISLDDEFRNLQQKENVVNLSQKQLDIYLGNF